MVPKTSIMKTITVEPIGSMGYKLLFNDTETATITYPKWYSMTANLDLMGSRYTIRGRGFWQTVQEIRKGDGILLEGRYKWKGLELSRPNDAGRPYLLKHKGFWGGTYALADHKGSELLTITSDFNWKKIRSNYNIVCADGFGDDEFEMLLILITVHYYGMYRASAASTGAATA